MVVPTVHFCNTLSLLQQLLRGEKLNIKTFRKQIKLFSENGSNKLAVGTLFSKLKKKTT